MTSDFEAFIEELSKECRFDRTLLKQYYETQIYSRRQAKYLHFEQIFRETWDKWVREKGNALVVSDFFVNYGDKLFREWLGLFFPFHTRGQRLILGFKGGGTYEDIVISMFYRFSLQELEIINKSFDKYKIREITPRAALTRMFLESFLVIYPVISKIVGYKYSLMLEESKILKKDQGRILHLEIVARPIE
jgi:hypothetical protein